MYTPLYQKVAVVVIYQLLECFAQDNSNFSPKDEIYLNKDMTTSNQTNASIICKLQMDDSSLQDIFNLMLKSTTQAVKIEISINTTKKMGNNQGLTLYWTSEIGRTIISLIVQTSPPIPWYFDTLSRGIEKANVVVTEEINGCLPTGDNGIDLIFDSLLQQLSHVNVTLDYRLCRKHGHLYKCCREVSYRKLSVCENYSSFVLSYAFDYIGVTIAVIVTIGLPLILKYLRELKENTKHYGIFDSPMALSSIFHGAFIDEKGPVRSAERRLVFSLTVAMMLYLSGLDMAWAVAASVWIIPFTAFDVFAITVVNDDSIDKDLDMYSSFIFLLTLPFNVKYWWILFRSCTFMDELSRSNYQRIQKNQGNHEVSTGRKIFQFLVEFFFVLVYLIFFIPICFFDCIFLTKNWCRTLFYPLFSYICEICGDYEWCFFSLLFTFFLPFSIFSLTLIIRSLLSFLSLSFMLIAGFYLNGEFYSPIVVPTLLLVTYSWKYWRSFVESKYLLLKTKIFEVCGELGNENPSFARKENETSVVDGKNIDGSSHFSVNVGKGTVSKALYEKLREILLPYDLIFFWLFVRLLFVASFFVFVAVMILLAQASGVSGDLQIISTMAAGTFPFIFDAIWAENTSEQKKVASMKLKLAVKQRIDFKRKTGDVIIVEIRSP